MMPPRKDASMASAKETFAALTVGKKVEVYKTVGETDIYLFAGITGDFARNHVDEEFMRRTRYGGRIAHGALLVGYMSRASTEICSGLDGTLVSYGFATIRFPGAAFIGDTVTVTYDLIGRDEAALKAFAPVTCPTQRADLAPARPRIRKV